MQDRSKITYKKFKQFFYIGFIMVLVGLSGFVVNTAVVIQNDFVVWLHSYIRLWDLTYQTQNKGISYAGWLFLYLLLSGIALIVLLSVFLLVELRGNSEKFAKRTKIIRKFGIFALTMYTIQGVFHAIHYLLTFWTEEPYHKLNWGHTLLMVTLTMVVLYGILWIWEKLRFIGTIEWIYGFLSLVIVPGKGARDKTERKEYFREKLNLKNLLYGATWLDLDPYGTPSSIAVETTGSISSPTSVATLERSNQRDSKIAFYYSLCSLIFFPYVIFSLIIVRSYRKRGYKDRRTWLTIVLSTFVILLISAIVVLSSIFTFETLGIAALFGY